MKQIILLVLFILLASCENNLTENKEIPSRGLNQELYNEIAITLSSEQSFSYSIRLNDVVIDGGSSMEVAVPVRYETNIENEVKVLIEGGDQVNLGVPQFSGASIFIDGLTESTFTFTIR